LEAGELVYANVYNGDAAVLRDVTFFTYATPRLPRDELVAPLRAAGLQVRTVGDSRAPRVPMTATAEGYSTAMDI
jgi:dimethylglycine catabolism A